MATIHALPASSPKPSEPSAARQPWMKFYPSDWRSDPKLRACSVAARGVWIELIGLMHEATPYGHLIIAGEAPDLAQLACQIGVPVKDLKAGLDELRAKNVYSVNESGVIFSRRMVRTSQRSTVNRSNAKLGGNPLLLAQSRKRSPSQSEPATDADSDNRNSQSRITETSPRSVITHIPEARGQNPQPPAGAIVPEAISEIAAGFLEAYPGIYAKCRTGARYVMQEVKYWPTALQLASAYPNLDRLLQMLEVFLKRTDIWDKNKPGTPGQFLHMAPDCDRLLRENGR